MLYCPHCSGEVERDPSLSGIIVVLIGFGLLGIGEKTAVAALGDLLQTFSDPVGGEHTGFVSCVGTVVDNVIVGVPWEDIAVENDGVVYLFDVGTADVIQTFTNPNPIADDHFGGYVTSMGDNILIAAPSSPYATDPTPGIAYLFDTSGNVLQTFENPAPNPHDGFGYSMAAVGDKVLISAPNDDTLADVHGDTGAAYLFDSSGNLVHTFFSPVASGGGDYFGNSVAAVGDKILIGAGGTGIAAYMFEFNDSTNEWELSQTFPNPIPGGGGRFGQRVAALGDDVLIGATGVVYLFAGDTGKLLLTLSQPISGQVYFGLAGAVGDNILAGAAHYGEVHLFDREGDLIHTFAKPPSDQDGGYGHSATAMGKNVVIGGGEKTYLFEGVPEPSTLILLATGALGVLVYAWRRRRQQVTR